MNKNVKVRVPMNIALVKYWGKRDEQLILPLNDSISLTVDGLYAETTVELVHDQKGEHTVEINGKEVDLGTNKRYSTVFGEALRLVRKRAHNDDDENQNGDGGHIHHENGVGARFKVSSTTNFPVAAGLASSAAGFAAISFGIKKLLDLDDIQANRLARIGSGSACRSMYGGLVQWKTGTAKDGSDCFAEKVSQNSWNDLRCIIFVFNDGRKKVGSTEGMRRTAETSELLKHRIEHVVDNRIRQITKAYENQDFDLLAQVIMADSNQFHACCLDSSPPIRYLNEASWKLIDLVEEFNAKAGKRRAAYTFDAGPNACVIVEKSTVPDLIRHMASEINVPSDDLSSVEKEFGNGEKIETTPSESFKASRLIVSSMGMAPEYI